MIPNVSGTCLNSSISSLVKTNLLSIPGIFILLTLDPVAITILSAVNFLSLTNTVLSFCTLPIPFIPVSYTHLTLPTTERV